MSKFTLPIRKSEAHANAYFDADMKTVTVDDMIAALNATNNTSAERGEQNARYENGWYYCWLIERRDVPQPEWLGAYDWVQDANDAVWYSRKSDADEVAGDLIHDHRVVVCEHGFMLTPPTAPQDRAEGK